MWGSCGRILLLTFWRRNFSLILAHPVYIFYTAHGVRVKYNSLFGKREGWGVWSSCGRILLLTFRRRKLFLILAHPVYIFYTARGDRVKYNSLFGKREGWGKFD